MERMKRISKRIAIILSIIVPFGYFTFYGSQCQPWQETSIDRAFRICQECGYDLSATNQLIDIYLNSKLSPEEYAKYWKQTTEPGMVELCKECFDAAIVAAEKKGE